MNAATETSESFVAPTTAPRPVRPFYWSVRRELWENRSLMIAPLVVGAIVLLGLLSRAVNLSEIHAILQTVPPDKVGKVATGLYIGVGVAVSLVMNIAVTFYLLDALQGERKDRSVLFWKSMPVSDTTAVLSKLFTGLVVSGAIVVVVSIITEILVLLLTSVILMTASVSPLPLWTQSQLFQVTIAILYAQIAMSLWYAPVAAWLLLVSSWAKRVTILWAVLPPVALWAFERMAIGTTYVQELLNYRLTTGLKTMFVANPEDVGVVVGNDETIHAPHNVLAALDPVGFFTNPWLWVGLVVAAGFVAAAIWMRRYREPL
jgi:ABC-2 type transport system permease protein